jgi:uncharacterized protein YndB with AHSA1/START domain
MTTDKARKRAVRSRMQKTGERYAAARRHVVRGEAQIPEQAPLPPRVAEPGMAEASLVKGTGHGWDHWFRLLDDWGAATQTHTEIARYVSGELGVGSWWSQTVTVGYERARGMRAVHERPEGFEVSVSKTVPFPALEAWRAFVEPSRRASWLDVGLRMRTGTRTMGRAARFDVPSDGSRINLAFTAKGEDRSVVAVTVVRLADAAAVEARRAEWRGRLAALARSGGDAAAGAGAPSVVARRGRRAS